MTMLPPQDPTQQKLEKAVTKMPKPKELEPPEMKPGDIPAPGSGPFGTTLTGMGSLPSAPTITTNVTGDKTPQPLLQSTTDVGRQMTEQQKQPMKTARYSMGIYEPGGLLSFLGDESDVRRALERQRERAALQQTVQKELATLKKLPDKVKETVVGLLPSSEGSPQQKTGALQCSMNSANKPPCSNSAFSKLARLLPHNPCLQSNLHQTLLGNLHRQSPEGKVERSKVSEEKASSSKTAKAHRLSRRMTFRDLNISIETDKGEARHWYDPHNDEHGSTKMKHPYGYIRRTKAPDGDHVDVYVGPNERAKNVYIVHQMKAPEFKQYDEDKCMLGFLTAEAAKKAYLAHYNKPGFFGSMTTMPFEEFKKKVLHTFELKRPHKIAEAIMNPHLRTAYLYGAEHSKVAFEKEAFTLIEALLTAGLLGGGGYGLHRLGTHVAESGMEQKRPVQEAIGRGLSGAGTGAAFAMPGALTGGLLGSLARRPGLGGLIGAGLGAGLGAYAGAAAPKAPKATEKEGQVVSAPTAVPLATQPDILGGILDTAEQGLGTLYQKGKAGVGAATTAGKSGLDRLLAALKKRPEQKKEARYPHGPDIIRNPDPPPRTPRESFPELERPMPKPPQKLEPDPRTLPKPPWSPKLGFVEKENQEKTSASPRLQAAFEAIKKTVGPPAEWVVKHPIAAGTLGITVPLGAQMISDSNTAEQKALQEGYSPEVAEIKKRMYRGGGGGIAGLGLGGVLAGLKAPGIWKVPAAAAGALIGSHAGRYIAAGGNPISAPEFKRYKAEKEIHGRKKESQEQLPPEAMMPPDQATADTAAPMPSPGLGDPNFWGGGAAAPGAGMPTGNAEDVINLLPAGTFQGMNVRITPDGQKSTGLKVTPEAIDAPEGLKALFATEPTARVEITQPETPSSVTSFKES